jgi:glucuronate isomerase
LGKLYHRHGFVMQLHIGTIWIAPHRRAHVGKSCGYVCIDDSSEIQGVGELLNRLVEAAALPKTIALPLDGNKWKVMPCSRRVSASPARAQGTARRAWWFNTIRTTGCAPVTGCAT